MTEINYYLLRAKSVLGIKQDSQRAGPQPLDSQFKPDTQTTKS